MTHYDPNLPLKLAADASQYGVGVVISNVLLGGDERPIAFASRSLSKSEQNYAQIDKEALALIFGILKFYAYIFGRKFTLVTDHQPLTIFWDQRKESLQLQQPGCRGGQFAFQLTPMISSSGAQQHMEMHRCTIKVASTYEGSRISIRSTSV